MTGAQIQRILKSGPRGLGILGRIGNNIGKVFKQFGAEQMGDAISQFWSGGSLSTSELTTTRLELQAWVTQRKDEILNDKRLSNKDMDILRETIGLAQTFTEPAQVLKIIADLTTIELTHNELKNVATGEPAQFPVFDDNAAAETIGNLVVFGFSEEIATQIVGGMLQYFELNLDLPTPAGWTGKRVNPAQEFKP
jgi:hypothetical protein